MQTPGITSFFFLLTSLLGDRKQDDKGTGLSSTTSLPMSSVPPQYISGVAPQLDPAPGTSLTKQGTFPSSSKSPLPDEYEDPFLVSSKPEVTLPESYDAPSEEISDLLKSFPNDGEEESYEDNILQESIFQIDYKGLPEENDHEISSLSGSSKVQSSTYRLELFLLSSAENPYTATVLPDPPIPEVTVEPDFSFILSELPMTHIMIGDVSSVVRSDELEFKLTTEPAPSVALADPFESKATVEPTFTVFLPESHLPDVMIEPSFSVFLQEVLKSKVTTEPAFSVVPPEPLVSEITTDQVSIVQLERIMPKATIEPPVSSFVPPELLLPEVTIEPVLAFSAVPPELLVTTVAIEPASSIIVPPELLLPEVTIEPVLAFSAVPPELLVTKVAIKPASSIIVPPESLPATFLVTAELDERSIALSRTTGTQEPPQSITRKPTPPNHHTKWLAIPQLSEKKSPLFSAKKVSPTLLPSWVSLKSIAAKRTRKPFILRKTATRPSIPATVHTTTGPRTSPRQRACVPNDASFSKAAVASDAEQCSMVRTLSWNYPDRCLPMTDSPTVGGRRNQGFCSRSVYEISSSTGKWKGRRRYPVGCKVLLRGGTAADAAVATLFCIGLANMHSSGVGGGGFALHYNKTSGASLALDFREVAPLFPDLSVYDRGKASAHGPLAVAVPGEVKGLHELWKRFGKLKWAELLEPAVQMAVNGYPITQSLAESLVSENHIVKNNSMLRSMFMPLGKPLLAGSWVRNPKLAVTLSHIQKDPESFYFGSIARHIAIDIRKNGGVMTLADLKNYKVKTRKVIKSTFQGYQVLTTASPSSGGVLSMILNMVEACGVSSYFKKKNYSQAYHRIVEAFKWAYSSRTKLGDPYFLNRMRLDKYEEDMLRPETVQSICRKLVTENSTLESPDSFSDFYLADGTGTTHLSIVDLYGNAIAVTSSINTRFGSGFTSESTGILFNSHMEDFSYPSRSNVFGLRPSPSNYVRPGKTPQSSSCPTIILDKHGNIVMVVGASGGSRITSAVAQVIINRLMFNMPLHQAVAAPRLHHQLTPYVVFYEKARPMPLFVIDSLRHKGNVVNHTRSFAACQAVFINKDGRIDAETDPRKPSRAYGF